MEQELRKIKSDLERMEGKYIELLEKQKGTESLTLELADTKEKLEQSQALNIILQRKLDESTEQANAFNFVRQSSHNEEISKFRKEKEKWQEIEMKTLGEIEGLRLSLIHI
eukprot:TRINITY_DN12721_c0_g1_i1.p1 TRINITY_DN12721_c0_g1~~TRINITY_DN12721_c0_g1_i1.p1  ORF type:complete len:111 (-),score=29.90 TRINITY_DN12721_c0_g1_i1:60-392(-)